MFSCQGWMIDWISFLFQNLLIWWSEILYTAHQLPLVWIDTSPWVSHSLFVHFNNRQKIVSFFSQEFETLSFNIFPSSYFATCFSCWFSWFFCFSTWTDISWCVTNSKFLLFQQYNILGLGKFMGEKEENIWFCSN